MNHHSPLLLTERAVLHGHVIHEIECDTGTEGFTGLAQAVTLR